MTAYMTGPSIPPAVTVITPTKNRLALLVEAIDSVWAQSFCDWEHIIVDDGSDDNTPEEVARRVECDPRIRFIRRDGCKGGANICRNIGLRESVSPYVLFLDSDDVLRPECLAGRVAAMERNLDLDFAVFPAGIFNHEVGDRNDQYHPMKPGDDLLRFLSHECVWEITGPIWRRQFLLSLGGFDEKLLSMQDLDLHVRALTARGRYVFVPIVDHDIRGHEDEARTSRQHFRTPTYIRGNEGLRKKLFEEIRRAGLVTWSRKRALLGMGFSSCEMLLQSRLPLEAQKAWSRECKRLEASWIVWLEGVVLLIFAAIGLPMVRLRRKWKGWRRLRPEPVPPEFLS